MPPDSWADCYPCPDRCGAGGASDAPLRLDGRAAAVGGPAPADETPRSPGSEAEVSWSGRGSLRIEGPAEIEWDAPRGEQPLAWRAYAFRRLSGELRRGEQMNSHAAHAELGVERLDGRR